MDVAEYCREIETYLCRKNDGHLIRIVGPAFEQVSGWAAQGVPLAVAFKGIDQYCERYYAKGPRRRPVRIEFCEGDILTLFDDWRRAVGVTVQGAEPESRGRSDSLPAHLDRVITRLTLVRGRNPSAPFDSHVETAIRDLDAMRASARHARGDARAAILARLSEIDGILLDAARSDLGAARMAELTAAAEAEVAPFAARMPVDARTRAVSAACDRLVRDAAGLPIVTLDA
jgi:hypothetical protein